MFNDYWLRIQSNFNYFFGESVFIMIEVLTVINTYVCFKYKKITRTNNKNILYFYFYLLSINNV